MNRTAEMRAEDEPSTEPPTVIYLPDLSVRAKKARSGSAIRQRRHLEQFRTDDAEHAALHERVRESGLSFGAFMRASGIGDAGARSRRLPRLPPIDAKAVARNNAELNMIGSNLNQAVRALNEIALDAGDGRLAQVAHLTQPILRALDELHITLAANRRALGHDREG
jgi:hypothetical protein